MKYKRIGIIDSGKGGELVSKRLKEKYPEVETFRLPVKDFSSYSNATLENLFILSKTHVDYLLEQRVDLIIIGCMTLSTNCLNFTRTISKGVKVLDLYSGLEDLDSTWTVIATENTIRSGKFNHCIEIPCGHLSTVIESRERLIDKGMNYSIADIVYDYNNTIEELLKGFISAARIIPTKKVILGCSHYPLALDQVKNVMGKDIEILDPIDKLLEGIK